MTAIQLPTRSLGLYDTVPQMLTNTHQRKHQPEPRAGPDVHHALNHHHIAPALSSTHQDYYSIPSSNAALSSDYLDPNLLPYPPYPAPSLPANAPGGSLFDDQEQNMFAQFFEQVGAGSENYESTPYGMPWDEPNLGAPPQMSDHFQTRYLEEPLFNDPDTKRDSDSASTPSQLEINPFKDVHGLVTTPSSAVPRPSVLNWGSDTHFGQSGYHPPLPPLRTDTEIRQEVYSALKDGEQTAPQLVHSPTEINFGVLDQTPNSPDELNTPTRIKRRVELKDDPKPPQNNNDKPSEPPAKRKKKGGGRRDNLTEDQKRENHIQSEQKRRDLIRQGFADLCALVPELREGGYSKSVVLMHAATFLEGLKSRVERLREYAAELEASNGGAQQHLPPR